MKKVLFFLVVISCCTSLFTTDIESIQKRKIQLIAATLKAGLLMGFMGEDKEKDFILKDFHRGAQSLGFKEELSENELNDLYEFKYLSAYQAGLHIQYKLALLEMDGVLFSNRDVSIIASEDSPTNIILLLNSYLQGHQRACVFVQKMKISEEKRKDVYRQMVAEYISQKLVESFLKEQNLKK